MCTAGLCCLPSTIDASLELEAPGIKPCWSTHGDVCKNYTPCLSLEGLDDKHGSPVELVQLKCTPHNLKFAEGHDDCANICQT